MDDPYRNQRKNEASMRPTSIPGHHQPGQEGSQRRSLQIGPAGSDRQRVASRTGQTLTGGSSSVGYGGYYQDPQAGVFPGGAGVPSGNMGYAPSSVGYGQDTRQAPNFTGTYNSPATGMVYNVQQQGPQNPVFDTGHPYPSRQPGAISIMPGDVGDPAYFPGDSTQIYAPQQNRNLADNRPNVAPDYGINVSTGGVPSHTTASTVPDQPATSSVVDTRDYAEVNEAFISYQKSLKEVFKNIRAGALAPAAESLLGLSDWLLSSIESLGLTVDDENLYEGRLKLWKNFNHAWLGLLEKQKESKAAGRQLHRTQSLISFDNLQKMARELVRLCDSVERFGLVDYEYGVWEEQIMSLLTECVDNYSLPEDEPSAAA